MAKGLKAECLKAVQAVIGRNLTQKESEDIVQSIKHYYTYQKIANPGLTKQELITLAAQDYAKQLEKQASRRKENARKQAVAVLNNRQRYKNFRDAGMSPNEAVRRILDTVDKNKIGVQEVYKSKLIDLIEKIAPRFLGLAENPKMIRDLLNEIAGHDTGNADAKAAAKAWIDTADEMRNRFNKAGGDIGEREDWLFPQTHDRHKIINAAARIHNNALTSAGKQVAEQTAGRLTTKFKHDVEENRLAWVDFVFPRLDKSKYRNNDLQPMTDLEIREMLGRVYDTLCTDGANKQEVDKAKKMQGKSKANQRAEHRSVYFKDADARYEYNSMFGTDPSVMGTMLSHVNNMSRDICLLEEMGPSPTNTYNTLVAMAGVDVGKQSQTVGIVQNVQSKFLDAMWANLNGTASMIQNGALASAGQGARNLQVSGKLGGAFLTSLADIGTYFHTARVNKMPYLRTAKLLLQSLNPADKSDKAFCARAGIIGDSINSAMSRFVEDNLNSGITGKLADLTMRLSLLSQLTDTVRRAQAMNTMATFAEATKLDWDGIDGWLKERLSNFGVDGRMWEVLKEAQAEELNGAGFLTIQSIRNISSEARTRLKISDVELKRIESRYLSFVMDDSFMSSLQPDLVTRTITNRGFPKGTVAGEIWRSVFLFKSFPIAMFTRHLQRSKDLYRYKQRTDGTCAAFASRTGYYISLIFLTTLISSVTNMFKDVVNGSDIKTPLTTDFWLRAFTSGGGAGFVGDILVSGLDDYKYGHPSLMNGLGPVLSTVLDTYTIYDKFKDNKDVGANLIRIAKSNLPLVNLWYAKQVINHGVFNQLQEMINPGYHARIERKIQKNQGVGFWWKPTEMTPRRAPRIGTQPDK